MRPRRTRAATTAPTKAGNELVGYIGDSGIRTPGIVLADMRSVDAAIRSLLGDVQKVGAPLGDQFIAEFAAFFDEWAAFYDDNASGFGGWWARGTTPVYNKVQEFRARSLKWRDAFVARGGRPSIVALPDSGGLQWWPILIIGAAVVGVTSYVFRGRDDDG